MRKKYLSLTHEQQRRGVLFSSQLQPGGTLHEVMAGDPDRDETIARLLNDRFFNASPYKYNEVRR